MFSTSDKRQRRTSDQTQVILKHCLMRCLNLSGQSLLVTEPWLDPKLELAQCRVLQFSESADKEITKKRKEPTGTEAPWPTFSYLLPPLPSPVVPWPPRPPWWCPSAPATSAGSSGQAAPTLRSSGEDFRRN